jgi:DNA-binding transcriptional LysR family regulator
VRLSDIDLNLLVVFEAIYREQSLTRAAQKLNLTQPALSHALARLRELFQDPLFARSGRAMLPSSFARTIIGPVRQALLTLEHGLFPSQGFDPKRTPRRFVVGLRDVLETVWLPVLVRQAREEGSALQLVSARVSRSELETDLSAGALDLAIEIPLPVSSAVRHREITQDRLVVMARRQHPVVRGGLDVESYLAHSHVFVSSRRKGPGVEDLVLRQRGQHRRIVLRCQNYLAACQVVRETDLLLTIPERLARSLPLEDETCLLPFPCETPPLSIHMYWHASADNDPANMWLRGQIERLAAQLASGA